MRISLCQINPTVGDLNDNKNRILAGIKKARDAKADIVVFPEMALTGYPPADFLSLSHFIKKVKEELQSIVPHTKGIAAIVGVVRESPYTTGKPLMNSACICVDGEILGFQDKTLLPTYDVFDELRYFEPARERSVWLIRGKKIAVTICEDIWQNAGCMDFTYPVDPIKDYKKEKIDCHLNLSASPFSLMKFKKRLDVLQKSALALKAPSYLCNQVGGNDSLIFEGRSLAVNVKGGLIGMAKGFQEDLATFDSQENQIIEVKETSKLEDLYQALILGLRDYFVKSGFKKAILGLSGGIDSALVACIAKEALGEENVLGVFMPSRYSSKASKEDSEALAKNLNIKYEVISIEEPFQTYLKLLHPFFEGKPADVTEENLQARIRGQILMALSNKFGLIVLSTGNKSELALGYSTLYGDLCGGIAVLSDVSKREVYELSSFINKNGPVIPEGTLTRAPSAELKENQKDSDSLPDYEIIDNILEAYVEHHKSEEEIAKMYGYPLELVMDLTTRIHRNEYKRRQSPPGLRVSEKAFSVGREFPIVQKWR